MSRQRMGKLIRGENHVREQPRVGAHSHVHAQRLAPLQPSPCHPSGPGRGPARCPVPRTSRMVPRPGGRLPGRVQGALGLLPPQARPAASCRAPSQPRRASVPLAPLLLPVSTPHPACGGVAQAGCSTPGTAVLGRGVPTSTHTPLLPALPAGHGDVRGAGVHSTDPGPGHGTQPGPVGHHHDPSERRRHEEGEDPRMPKPPAHLSAGPAWEPRQREAEPVLRGPPRHPPGVPPALSTQPAGCEPPPPPGGAVPSRSVPLRAVPSRAQAAPGAPAPFNRGGPELGAAAGGGQRRGSHGPRPVPPTPQK